MFDIFVGILFSLFGFQSDYLEERYYKVQNDFNGFEITFSVSGSNVPVDFKNKVENAKNFYDFKKLVNEFEDSIEFLVITTDKNKFVCLYMDREWVVAEDNGYKKDVYNCLKMI